MENSRKSYEELVGFRKTSSSCENCSKCSHMSSYKADSSGVGCYLYDAYIGDTQHKTEFGCVCTEGLHGTVCGHFEKR